MGLFHQLGRRENVPPLEVPVVSLADYLSSLFNRGLAPATIKVLRAALSSVLRLYRVFTTEEEDFFVSFCGLCAYRDPESSDRLPRGTWG